MKKIFSISACVLLLACLSSTASAQLMNEDFSYPVGDSVAIHGWPVSSAASNPILITSPGLTFPGYPGSGIGNAVHLTFTGQDVRRVFKADSTGSFYASFMVNMDTTKTGTGDYFFAYTLFDSPTSIYGRVFVKSSGNGYVWGIGKNNETTQPFDTTVFAFKKTYLVVLKYTFVPGDTNDVVSLYVLPEGASLASEPTKPLVGPYATNTKGDARNIGAVTLRQGTTANAPALTLDGVRVDSTWKGVMTNPITGPSIYSIGTGNVPGEAGHFASLKAACDSVNALSGAGIKIDMIFYITSALTEAANVALGPNTNGHTITFKPYTGVTPTITFTQVADNVGLSGAWVIGVKNLTTTSTTNYGLTVSDSTENIIIDGSNSNFGTTRDLTIVTAIGTHGNTTPLKIFGNTNYVTVKNINVITGQSVSYGIQIVPRGSSAPVVNYLPDYVTIENCNVTNVFGSAGQSIAISNSGTPTGYTSNVIIRNNKLTATTRGIFLNYAGDTEIYGNEIYVNQTVTGSLSEGIFANLIGSATNVVNIYNNKILQLSTANVASGSLGIYGIYISTNGIFNIYNNIITGFNLPSGFQGIASGIGVVSATVNGITANVYNNSVYMRADTTSAGIVAPIHSAFYLNLTGASGTRVATVKNNIFANARTNYATQAFTWGDSSKATLVSDFNVLYTAGGNGKVGKRGTLVASTIEDWKTLTQMDAKSVSGTPQFVSAADLHINASASPVSAASNGGTPIALVTKDIDGELRSATTPDIGADEFTAVIPSGAPVVTIGEARKDLNKDFIADRSLTKDTLTVYGIINSPNFNALQTSYFMQDATGGINIFSYTPIARTFTIGDSVKVVGYVAQYRGVTELVLLDTTVASFSVVKSNAAVLTPKRVTLQQFVADPESYEGQLLEIDSLYKSSGVWPTASTYSSVYVTNLIKKDSLQLFLDNDTDIDGSPEPKYPLKVAGIISQYTTAVIPNNGYELMPRGLYDIKSISTVGVETMVPGLPKTYELMNNYPNPFNPTTTIKFSLPQQSTAKLVVYDMLGREVRTLVNTMLNAGYFEVSWNGKNNNGMQVSSGLYLYRIEAGSFVAAKKMMLLK